MRTRPVPGSPSEVGLDIAPSQERVPSRPPAAGVLRRFAALALVGPNVWVCILLADGYLTEGRGLVAADAALFVEIGLRQSAWVVASCALLALLEHLLSRRVWLTRLLVLLALAAPCIDQALFLTAGDGISGHAYIRWIRVGLTAALLTFSASTIEWLRLGLRGALPSRTARALSFLGFALTTLSAGLPLAWRWPEPGLIVAGLVELGSLLFVFGARSADSDHGDIGAAPFANLARAAVGPHRPSEVGSINFDSPARFRCRAPGARSLTRGPGLAKERRKNVILISVDALRRDMVHLVEAGTPVMPRLSEFATTAIEFTGAVTSYPATIYALGSAFTGYSPSELLLAPTLPTSILAHARGKFESVNAILPGTRWFKMPAIDRLLLQGLVPKRASSAIQQTDLAINYLKSARKRNQTAFLWLHYFEPHDPYQRHAELDFGDGKRAAYLSEVALVDRELGRLLAVLRRDHWLDDSLILIFADHGESLGEQNRFGHHVSLDASIIDIPLVMHYPGVSATTLPDVVGIADVTPTVLDFADLPVQEDLGAQSLFAALDGPEPRSLVAESFPMRGESLFELANEPILDVEQLRARADATYQQAAERYTPKVSIVLEQHRLIVDRETGDEQLFLLDKPSRDKRVDLLEPTLLTRMRAHLAEWHEREAELIYCRVVGHRR
jgi:arylsulfatase A-like enzyme